VSYIYSCIPALAGLVMIVLGVTILRQANPTSGYLFAVAGAVELLTTCCGRVLGEIASRQTYDGSGDTEVLWIVQIVLWNLGHLVALLVVAAAFATLARSMSPPQSSARL